MKFSSLVLAGFFSAFFSLAAQAHSESNPDCPEQYFLLQNVQLQQMWSSRSGQCLILVSQQTHSLVYRAYMFSSSGKFLIFNSYGEGPEYKATGARSYWLYPRGGLLSYEVQGEDIAIHLPSSLSIVIETQTGWIKDFPQAQWNQDTHIKPSNKGGLEIESVEGALILDAGFSMGRDAIEDSSRSSSFRDSRGETCVRSNLDIFDYSDRNEVVFRWPKDSDLKSYLQESCPNLELPF